MVRKKIFLPLGLLLIILFLAACGERVKLNRMSIEELTISDIHRSFEDGVFTAEDLVRAYLERIAYKDDALNAITFINPTAIERARQLDSLYKSTGRLLPLHGIPFLVKDNINTIGLPTTAGALALQQFIPESNAFVIDRLEKAGAIVLAKTNMAEWAFSPMHTESSTAGITRNPYGLNYVPAGSSGGTASAIAANFGAIGLGTDTGNSIRGPSAHCALVGFRTTMGLISREGIVPLYLRNDVVGPMCRSVEDAVRMLDVIAGEDPEDPLTSYGKSFKPTSYMNFLDPNGLQGARIGVFREIRPTLPEEAITRLLDSALLTMELVGAEIIDNITIPNFDQLSQDQWCADFRKDVEAFLNKYVSVDTLSTLEDIIKVGTKSEFASRRLNMLLQAEGRWSKSDTPCGDPFTDEQRIAYRRQVESVMDSLELDAIVYPSWHNSPASIELFEAEYKGDNSQLIAPHTGQPAFTVPMGYGENGLPAGLQFLGRMFDESTLIKLVYAYEQASLHRKPPRW